MGAAKLFFVTESGGMESGTYTIPDGVYVSSDGIVSQLTVAQAGNFIDLRDKERPMMNRLELVSMGYRAMKKRLYRVHIVGGQIEGMISERNFFPTVDLVP